MSPGRLVRAVLVVVLLSSCPAIDAFAAAGGRQAAGPGPAARGPDKVAGQVERAAQLLFAPGRSDSQVVDGLRTLVEAMAGAASEAGTKGGIAEKIAEARRQVGQGPFTEEAAALLNECYSLLHDGKPFRMPEGVRTIQQVEEHGRRLLDSARDLLRQGKPAESLRPLVETAVMIITPVHAEEGAGRE